MKLLITGGCGFIGSHVTELAVKRGHKVLVLDNLSTGQQEYLADGALFFKCDITAWLDLVSEFVDFEPDIVLHLAAQAAISRSWDQPTNDAWQNVIGTLNILRVSERKQVQRVVVASTSAVYSQESIFPISLGDRLEPNTPYGISKLAAESYARLLFPNSIVLRLGNVYGPRQVPLGENQVIAHMLEHFEEGKPFYIHGDGNQERDFVYVEDVAEAFLQAAESSSSPGTYNVATGNSISIMKLAEMFAAQYGVPDYKWEHDDKHDPRRMVGLDVSASSKRLGWTAKIGIQEGLRRTISWRKAK
jgi:UDP-glucose 4-epimerase